MASDSPPRNDAFLISNNAPPASARSLFCLTCSQFSFYLFDNCSFAEMMTTVNLERALEMQRVKLLRLLTGWFAVVALITAGPLAVPLPRWVRAVFADLLVRAEFAAQCLVRVSARLQAGERWAVAGASRSAFVGLATANCADDIPSTTALLRRMRALRRLLQDLPRFGRRLLRRLSDDSADAFLESIPTHESRAPSVAPQWVVPGIERPPDRLGIDLNLALRSRSFGDGRLSAWPISVLAYIRWADRPWRNSPSRRRSRSGIRAIVAQDHQPRPIGSFV